MSTGGEEYPTGPIRDRTFVSPDDENLSSALEVAANLMQICQEPSTEWLSTNTRADVADIVHDVTVFASMVRFAENTHSLLPTFHLPGDDVPLPIRLWLGNPFAPRYPHYFEERYAAYYAIYAPFENPSYIKSPEGEFAIFQMEPIEVVKDAFRSGLVSFLVARFKGRQSAPSRSQSPGAAFQVSSNSTGLRVYYHPTYWHDPNRVFGQPTTPVNNYLQAGRWSFGAAGPSLPLTFESAWYDVPKHSTAHLNL